ncbi:MAG: DJ-1/PfpI family protein [Bacteroidota bacterium]
MRQNVGIFIFDNAEVLDFAGPFEVFGITSQLNNNEPFQVFTVARTMDATSAVNGLSVNPTYDFDSCPPIDILILSGGNGTKSIYKDDEILSWVQKTYTKSSYTLSICSGSRLLGELGLLDNRPYCTHHGVYEDMGEIVPTGLPQPDQRFVKSSDKIYTSGGISAGIDLSFAVVDHLLGRDIAERTARHMEYNWVPTSD